MLGALVVFLQFLLYGLCWNLNKKMKDLKDAGNSISMGLFVGCSIVNFIVLVPILTIILWPILLGIFGFKGPVNEDGMLVVAGIFSCILSLCVIFLHYNMYKDYLFDTNHIGNILEKSTEIFKDTKQRITNPDTFTEVFSFIEFVKANGPTVGLASHTNKNTGKEFHTLEIKDDTGKTISVRFHSSLGELSSEQLKERKSELYVGKRNSDLRWYLYDKNYKDTNGWEEVDLGISDSYQIEESQETYIDSIKRSNDAGLTIKTDEKSKTERTSEGVNWLPTLIAMLVIAFVIWLLFNLSGK